MIYCYLKGVQMNKPYKNISDTNTAFGNLFGSAVKNNVIVDYDKILNQSLNLYDELDELRDDSFKLLRVNEQDKKGRIELVDAIADLIVFSYGTIHFLGVDYTEMTSDSRIVEALSSIPKPQFYDIVYDDILKMIDVIIQKIKEKADVDSILKTIKDLDTYLMSLAAYYNVDMTLLIQRVTDSNLSKLCLNDADTKATLHFYEAKGVEVYSGVSPIKQTDGSPYYVVYSSKEQVVQDKVYRAHKFLKCINWYEPDLSDI